MVNHGRAKLSPTVQTFELVTGALGKIFNMTLLPGMTTDEIRLARIEELCGPFPASILHAAPHRATYFNLGGTLRYRIQHPPWLMFVLGTLRKPLPA